MFHGLRYAGFLTADAGELSTVEHRLQVSIIAASQQLTLHRAS
jgi:hypothetical protein